VFHVTRIILVLVFLAALRPQIAAAQQAPTGEPDPARVRLTIGPLLVNPTISLTNLGVDNNVFNEADQQNPKQDFTVTVTPAADFWLRFGPTWLSAQIKEDLVWYQEFESERSANTTYAGNWRVPFNRLVLRFGGSYLNTHDRPGYEIDARVRRTELGYNGGVELRALAKTSLLVYASRLKVDYDDNATYQGANLQNQLNRLSTTFGGGVKYQATPLTTLSFTASRLEDRFEFSPLRDSNSNTVALLFNFDPVALIKGSASIGYRDFKPVVPGLEAFDGFTTSVDLSYTLLSMTRFGVKGTRDVQYSFDVNQPYYLLSGVDLSIAQQVFGPFDIVGRVGRQKLAYRDRAGAAVAVSDRIDYVDSYGGSIGYHIGPELRAAFNVDHYNRVTEVTLNSYDNLRFGFSLTYGF
jgi:putative beta-barrel porin BBP2